MSIKELWGFDEATTVGEIGSKSNVERIIDVRNQFSGTKGLYDTVTALVLGGVEAPIPNKTYNLGIAPSGDGTWQSNVTRGFFKINKIQTGADEYEKFKELVKSVKPTDTLSNVIVKLNQSGLSEQKKKELRKAIDGSDEMELSKEGKNMENNSDKKVRDIVEDALEANKQVIFTGAPGTGKTYSVRKYVEEMCKDKENGEVDKNQFKFVQFHPSYDYSDFVEGLRPVVVVGQTESTFVRLDGVFKAFCRHIVEENRPEKNYYFIVDEINRADLAKVFGELMFGLEESYRGEKNKFDTQYKNLITYEIAEDGKAVPMEHDVFKDGFYIPENLYFIGTMNDIDRSVDSMDFALRRRFTWVNIRANEIMRTSLHDIFKEKKKDQYEENKGNIDKLAEVIIDMNHALASPDNKFGLTEDYHIGPAYFKNMKDIGSGIQGSLKTIFENNIASIIREYTRGRKREDVEKLISQCKTALHLEN